MRYLYRLNAEKGSGKQAEVPGYRVGGKTGTAEKVVNGRYSADKRFNAFLAAFPMDDPQFIVLSDHRRAEAGEAGHGSHRRLQRRADRGQHHPALCLPAWRQARIRSRRRGNAGFLAVILGRASNSAPFVYEDWTDHRNNIHEAC